MNQGSRLYNGNEGEEIPKKQEQDNVDRGPFPGRWMKKFPIRGARAVSRSILIFDSFSESLSNEGKGDGGEEEGGPEEEEANMKKKMGLTDVPLRK